MNIRHAFLGFCAAVTFIGTAQAQIQIDQLGAASAYDGGTLDQNSGGLDSSLWQGTSATRATNLIEGLNGPKSQASEMLYNAALLSGGVPPQATDTASREAYVLARIGSILRRGDLNTFDVLAQSANADLNNPAFRQLYTDRDLLAGHTDKACSTSDTITELRTLPYWAKLRAFCHYKRGEIPAAELTADILRRNQQGDPAFFDLLGSLTGSRIKQKSVAELTHPLNIAMARDYMTSHPEDAYKVTDVPAVIAAEIAYSGEYDAGIRLTALKQSAHLLNKDQLHAIFSGFGATPLDNFDTLNSVQTWTAPIWGQAYEALKRGNDVGANAVIAVQILTRAEKAGIFGPIADLIASDLQIIPASLLSAENPELFARVALRNRDFGMLSELYRSLTEDKPVRGRIALASDALGGGFTQAELGTDIETRLAASGADRRRAIRDTFIATALGGQLSESAATIIGEHAISTGTALPPGQMLALRAAAKRGAKAETALLAAAMIGETPVSKVRDEDLADILFAFHEAGMFTLAGNLAALDFLGSAP
jgi:hypothetical protein